MVVLSACAGAVAGGDEEAKGGTPALTQGSSGNGEFSHEEVDYLSAIPGLDIVRVNPMLTEPAEVWLLSAQDTGWFWDFETRMSNPWNVGASTSTLFHMGRMTVLRGNDNAQNHARGLFYNLSFDGAYFATAKLDDLVSGTTTNFVSVVGSWNNSGQFERLTSRVFRNGNAIVYEYEDAPFQQFCASLRIKHVGSGAFLYVKRILLDGSCIPEEITLPDRVSKIVYQWAHVDTDVNGLNGRVQLAQVTYPDGTFKKYTYRALSRGVMSGLTGVVDEEGRPETSFVWNGDKVVSSYAGPAGHPQNTLSITDNDDGTRTVTDAEGIARVISFKEWTNPTGVKFKRFGGMSAPCAWCASDDKDVQYNDVGLITKTVSQRDVVTTLTPRFNNGVLNNVTTKVIAAGTAEAKTISTTWDARFNLPTKSVTTDATGGSVASEVTYDDKGRPTRVTTTQATRAIDGSNVSISKTTNIAYSFHSNGQIAMLTVDGPRPPSEANDVAVTTYSPEGLLLSESGPLGTTVYGNFDALGRAQTITYPNGLTTSLTYDWADRVLSRNTAGVVTVYTYYKNGLLKTEITPGTAEVTTYEYDAANRLTTATDGLGNRREFSYDALGRQVLAREGNIAKGVLSLSLSSQYSNGNRTVSHFPTGVASKVTAEFDENFQLIGFSDGLLKSVGISRDALGRASLTKNNASQLLHVPQFDVADNVRQSSYSGVEGTVRSRLFQYTVEASGPVWESQAVDTGKDTLLHDLAGNLTDNSNTSGGNTIKRIYDALNRVKQATIVNPTTGGVLGTINYTYDVNPSGSTPAPLGLLTQVSGSFGSAKYTYDAQGNVVQKAQSHGPATFFDSYTYDGAGRVLSITYPSGRVVRMERDAVGQPSAVQTKASGSTAAWNTVADAISYYPFTHAGEAKEMRLGGSTQVASRLRDTTGLVTAYSEGPGNSLITVQRRLDGLISRLTSGNGTNVGAYEYDASNRLKSASGYGFAPQNYVFESTGDLKSLTDGTLKTLTYASNSSRLINAAGAPVTYAQRGAVASVGDLKLTYDARGMVSTFQKGNGVKYTYTYDALGRRQSKARTGEWRPTFTTTLPAGFWQSLTPVPAKHCVNTFGSVTGL